jgi:plasmid stabilization system protein ParE
MRVRFTATARVQLDEISAWLEQRRPRAADRLSVRMAQLASYLGNFPLAGPLKYKSDVRVLPVRGFPYLIFYRVRPEAVEIVSIRHAARRPLREDDLT